MKKIVLLITLILLVQIQASAHSYIDKQLKEATKNQKYKTTQTQIRQYAITTPKLSPNIQLKDPKLIILSDIKPVNENDYKVKITTDEKIYKNEIYESLKKRDVSTVNVQPSPVDFYSIYRVAEKIIRANNLEYVNWRIAVRKSEDLNALAGDANYIQINTGIYDSFYSNPDALAFIIAHEMAHLLLGHSQRKAEFLYRLQRMQKAKRIGYMSNSPNLGAIAYSIQEKRMFAESRKMEDMADILAAELITKAGYNMGNALEVLNLFDNLPEVNKLFAKLNSEHPYAQERINSINENRAIFPVAEWTNEGKYNILNSNVLKCKKSSDRVSIIITKDTEIKNYFELEPLDKKLLRIAYMNYKNGNMVNAVKYFKKLNEVQPSYINYLYLSYANEYLYMQTKDEKYLNQARKDAQDAKQLNPNDINTDIQLNAL